MNRSLVSRVLSLLLASGLTLSAWPAQAQQPDRVEIIPMGTTTSTETEDRILPTKKTEERIGARTLKKSSAHTEEVVTGPTTKLIKEFETRDYSFPVDTFRMTTLFQRAKTTTTTNFIRRTTRDVIVDSKKVWIYANGILADGSKIYSGPRHIEPAEFRERPLNLSNYSSESRELPESHLNTRKTITVTIYPANGEPMVSLAFDLNLRFLGGRFIDALKHGSSEIRVANLTRYADHDAITFHMECTLRDDWWRVEPRCGTSVTRTYHLKGRLIETPTRYTYEPRTTEESYSKYSYSSGRWVQSDKLETAGKPLSTRTETASETVLLRQYTASNTVNAAQTIASGALDTRRSFTADSSSGKGRAMLTGAKVRQQLGADRTAPSRIPSLGRGGGAPPQAIVTRPQPPKPTPRPQPTPRPDPMPKPMPVTGLVPVFKPMPVFQPTPVTKPTPKSTPTPSRATTGGSPQMKRGALPPSMVAPDPRPIQKTQLAQAWWFPQNPQHLPLRVRFDAYLRKNT